MFIDLLNCRGSFFKGMIKIFQFVSTWKIWCTLNAAVQFRSLETMSIFCLRNVSPGVWTKLPCYSKDELSIGSSKYWYDLKEVQIYWTQPLCFHICQMPPWKSYPESFKRLDGFCVFLPKCSSSIQRVKCRRGSFRHCLCWPWLNGTMCYPTCAPHARLAV